jgi:PhnB protein
MAGRRPASYASSVTSATVYLTVDDGAAALDFYGRAFGAVATMRMDDGSKLAHATLSIGDAVVMVSDEYPAVGAVSPATLGGSTSAVVLEVEDPDAVFATAVAAGARADRPVAVDGGGARSGWLTDPFGHRWNIRGTS